MKAASELLEAVECGGCVDKYIQVFQLAEAFIVPTWLIFPFYFMWLFDSAT